MKKPYVAHENKYREMLLDGCRSWDEATQEKAKREKREVAEEVESFLKDVLSQPWAPTGGKAIELGCGTAPILRWLCKRGFSGYGVDVSKSAIAMAREQSKGFNVKFRCADVCSLVPPKKTLFDLAVDGHCLHCITDTNDRRAFLSNTRRLLRDCGVFIVMTMCGPVKRKVFMEKYSCPGLIGGVSYAAIAGASEYEEMLRIKDEECVPTRYFGHWQEILREIRGAGFHPQLVRYVCATEDEPIGFLEVAAMAV